MVVADSRWQTWCRHGCIRPKRTLWRRFNLGGPRHWALPKLSDAAAPLQFAGSGFHRPHVNGQWPGGPGEAQRAQPGQVIAG